MDRKIGTLLGWVLMPIIVLSSFFQSVLVKVELNNDEKINLKRVMIHIGYSLSICISSGLVLSIIGLITLSLKYNILEIGKYTLFWIPLFFMIMSVWIVFLNYDNKEFSLPKTTFTSCWLLVNMNFKWRFWESIICMLLFPIILGAIIVGLLSSYSIPFNESKIIVTMVFTICFFISLTIYSEATKDELKRSARQFIIWMVIFLGFTAVTIYQVSIYILQGKTMENIINISIAILGIALTMTTIIDKTRAFYTKCYETYEKSISESLEECVKIYSIDKVLKKVKDNKREFIEISHILYQWWKNGKKLKVIFFIITLISVPIVFIAINKFSKNASDFLDVLFEYVKKIWVVQIFNGNKQLSNNVLIIGVTIGFLVKCTVDLIKRFKSADIINKIRYIIKVLGLILILSLILGTVFTNLLNSIRNWVIRPLILILMILLISLFSIEKFKKKEELRQKSIDTN